VSVNNPPLADYLETMPKTKQQKEATVETLVNGFKTAKSVVFANFQGLTVADSSILRRDCRKDQVEVLAAKKTLIKKACEEMGLKEIDPKIFQGGVAAFMGYGDEISAPKAVNVFAKGHEIVTIFGGIFEGKFVPSATIKSLASLPGRTELLSQLVGSLNSPISGFANVLAGNLRGLVNVLNAYKDKVKA